MVGGHKRDDSKMLGTQSGARLCPGTAHTPNEEFSRENSNRRKANAELLVWYGVAAVRVFKKGAKGLDTYSIPLFILENSTTPLDY